MGFSFAPRECTKSEKRSWQYERTCKRTSKPATAAKPIRARRRRGGDEVWRDLGRGRACDSQAESDAAGRAADFLETAGDQRPIGHDALI